MTDAHTLSAELLGTGYRLWSSVECDVKRDRVVVYACLCAHPPLDLRSALAESKRVFFDVLGDRLEGQSWLATVYWGERLCKTFTP